MSGTNDPPQREPPLKLDSPLLVQWEYASEERLAVRNQTYKDLVEGTNAEEVVFEAVRESSPERVLEVGCGIGELAERVRDEVGAEVCAVDISPRMVELTVTRGLEAKVAAELWEAVGDSATRGLTFGSDNGAQALERRFTDVERRDANGTVVFPDREAMRRFVAATITRAHLADRVPEVTEPFRARTAHVIFTARKA